MIPAGLLDACPTPQQGGTNRPNTHSTVQADNHQQQTHSAFWLFISSQCQKFLHVFLEFFPCTFVMHADTSPSWLSSQSISNLLVYQGVPTSSSAPAILELRDHILRGYEHPHSRDHLFSESARTKHMYICISERTKSFFTSATPSAGRASDAASHLARAGMHCPPPDGVHNDKITYTDCGLRPTHLLLS
jgi:hypothetical protein